jgi:hypothetical protein
LDLCYSEDVHSSIPRYMPLCEGDIVGGTLLGRVGGIGFKFVFIKDGGKEGVNGNIV